MRYFIFWVTLLLVSCDNWVDYYQSTNEKPTILIRYYDSEQDYNTLLSDSLKLNNYFNLEVKLTDDYDPEKLTLRYFSKDFEGDFTHENDIIKIKPAITGKIELAIICEDIYGKNDTAIVKLVVFNNIVPIAALDFSYKNESLTLNASNSYDPDKKYGGGIERYEFYIGGNIIPWANPVIEITTSILTTTEIGVRVQDNEGAWSNWVKGWVVPAN